MPDGNAITLANASELQCWVSQAKCKPADRNHHGSSKLKARRINAVNLTLRQHMESGNVGKFLENCTDDALHKLLDTDFPKLCQNSDMQMRVTLAKRSQRCPRDLAHTKCMKLHHRFMHRSFEGTQKLMTDLGLDAEASSLLRTWCKACEMAKATQHRTTTRIEKDLLPGQSWRVDVMGKCATSFDDECTYAVVFVDEASNAVKPCGIMELDDVADVMCQHVAFMKTSRERSAVTGKVRCHLDQHQQITPDNWMRLGTDSAERFNSQRLKDFYQANQVEMTASGPGQQHRNGKAENAIKLLCQTADAARHAQKQGKDMWWHAFQRSAMTSARAPPTKTGNHLSKCARV